MFSPQKYQGITDGKTKQKIGMMATKYLLGKKIISFWSISL
jgi:hypothetical protein